MTWQTKKKCQDKQTFSNKQMKSSQIIRKKNVSAIFPRIPF
jgi:hypothetical protein